MPESLKQQIDRLEELYESELDPQGRAFVPLADAHRRLGDLDKALAVVQQGLGAHPDFASAHLVLGWVHRSRQEPDDAMRSFERVLALDAENTFARAAIAELIDDQRAQSHKDGVAAKVSDEPTDEMEGPVVPIDSLVPGALVETVVPIASLAPEASVVDGRSVVPIASLAPGAIETAAAPESVPDDGRPVVPIASLAPGEVVGEQDMVPIRSLVPGAGSVEAIQASSGDGLIDGEIYTQTLAELYAVQGATDKAIEVYEKLISEDPDNGALCIRLTELESLDTGADGAPAQLDIRAGLGALVADIDDRQTVSIESLAPDGDG